MASIGRSFLALALIIASATQASQADASEHWYFEAISSDGKRALLRELDTRRDDGTKKFHIRIVDVATNKNDAEVTLPELARIPSSTIGSKATDLAQLEWMLTLPAFSRDLVTGGTLVKGFPFGECGRVAAGGALGEASNATNTGSIAFDAGDWLYVADEQAHVRRRLVEEAAYDPRFSPDGKWLFFRQRTGSLDSFAKYELMVVPSDLSVPPRAIPNTAGVRDRFTLTPDGQSAIAIASHSGPNAETCAISISMKAPAFTAKKLACLEGNEQLVESVVSPKGKFAAFSTKRRVHDSSSAATAPIGKPSRLDWRLRVVSLANGKVMRDEPDVAGLGIRAISDTGLLVQSGMLGVVVHDVPAKKWHDVPGQVDLGHRGFFRNDKELVYLTEDGNIAVLDVTKE